MSTIVSFFAGGASLATLLSLPPETIQMFTGIAAGALVAVCVLYLYLLARQPQPAYRQTPTQPKRRRTPAKLSLLAGQMALQGGAA